MLITLKLHKLSICWWCCCMQLARLNMSVKFPFKILCACKEETSKNLRGYFFAAPCIAAVSVGWFHVCERHSQLVWQAETCSSHAVSSVCHAPTIVLQKDAEYLTGQHWKQLLQTKKTALNGLQHSAKSYSLYAPQMFLWQPVIKLYCSRECIEVSSISTKKKH